MKKLFLLLLVISAANFASAQKIDSIYFHLYTDSLKKGFFNYINVDGKTTDGNWLPLSSKEINLTVNKDSALRFENNDLFIDSSYTRETVTVRATLKENPKIWREVTIYIQKRGFDEPLKSNQEIFEEYSKPQKSKKKNLTSS
jgi:hypothetical protein